MRNLMMAALAALLLAAGGMNAATLNANETAGGFWTLAPQGDRGVPRGDYQETCRDIRMNGNQLHARCQELNGGWRSTSLDARRCQKGIINDNGYLRCADFIPPGDYRRTCQNVRISGQRLEATCQRTNGGWRTSSLNNFERCGDKISNVDGRLVCGI